MGLIHWMIDHAIVIISALFIWLLLTFTVVFSAMAVYFVRMVLL